MDTYVSIRIGLHASDPGSTCEVAAQGDNPNSHLLNPVGFPRKPAAFGTPLLLINHLGSPDRRAPGCILPMRVSARPVSVLGVRSCSALCALKN